MRTDYQSAWAADHRREAAQHGANRDNRGWDFEPGNTRPRVVPMALTAVVAALIFILPLIAWCVL